MANDREKRQQSNASLFLGGILVLLGIVFLVGQVFSISLGDYLWPFFIIVPGVLLFIFALSLAGGAGEGFAILGSIVTMVGLILFYQNTTGHWESWAYAWALIAPTSIGLGQIAYGTLKGRGEMVKNGTRVAAVGLGIFLVGGFFFELILGIGGLGLGGLGWPLLLIGLGILLLVSNLLSARK
ncbi:MAG: hypothetical protein IT330_01950 [Anaerolineae bacterium]|nr:hypothetical protein [Anaerolineae bacterium]